MTIETIFETDTYRWDFDNQYGTGWFVRKADDHVSLMDTGVDALDAKQEFENIGDDIYKRAAFYIVADSQDYSPRWSN